MGKTSLRIEGSTRADRKFLKKLQFYESAKGAVAEKAISKEKQQKKRRSRRKKPKAFDLSSLAENLPKLKAPKQRKKRRSRRKPTAFDLSSLAAHLPELKAPRESSPADVKPVSRSRNNLVLKEAKQMDTVLNHPAFISDPLEEAIYQHLRRQFIDFYGAHNMPRTRLRREDLLLDDNGD